jgi:hypothetical protein
VTCKYWVYYNISDEGFDLTVTLIFFSIYKAYYISNQNQKKVDIFKNFKDEVNNVFDTNIFRQVKFFSPLANIFCYIYNQSKNICNFLFLYIPDSHYYLLFSIVLTILCMVIWSE